MPADPPQPASPSDDELEREIRNGRSFSMAEAIGRLAGPGAIKGASPITRQQQAETTIEEYLKEHLPDATGALLRVVLRHLAGSTLLLEQLDQPLTALTSYVRQVLDSDALLKELVRETDMEWGRIVGERPYFEQAGRSADPDDPYTVDSVRHSLTNLLG